LGPVLHVALRERVALGDQAADLLDEAGDTGGVLGFSVDEQIMTLGTDADVQQAFEVSQVVVVGPEKRGEPVLVDGYAARGSGSDRDISLCCKELTDLRSVA
jgi:hypothetical protein